MSAHAHEPFERARFMDRAIAWSLDVLLVIGLVWLAAQVVAALAGWPAVGVLTSNGAEWRFAASPAFTIVIVAIAVGYNVLFWQRFGGATPGKRLMGLRVLSRQGGPLTLGQAVGRSLAYLLSLPFLAGFLWAALDRRHETFHDKLAGTAVFRLTPAA